MPKIRIDAEVIDSMLDQYLDTAVRYALSPGNTQLLIRLEEVFADMERLRLPDRADWPKTWGRFAELHQMILARPPQVKGAVNIRQLVSLKNNFIRDLGRRGNTAYLVGSDLPYTVPMSTGRRGSLGSVAKRSPQFVNPAAGVPDPVVRTEPSASVEKTLTQHGERATVAPRFEKRHLTARAPSVVAPDAKFSIIAFIDVAPAGEGVSTPLAEVAIPENGLMVTIETFVEGNLKLLGSSSLQVRVFPGKKSPEIEIAFQATALGSAEAVLRARTDQAYLGDLRISMMVAKQGTPDLRDVKAGIAAPPPTARKATLTVNYSRKDRRYRFMLFGDATGIHNAEQTLDEDIDVMVPRLMAQVNGLARGTAGYSAKDVERMLSGIGAEMWSRLLPDKIKAVLAARWNGLDRLDIVSEDDMLPWELLFAHTTGGPQMGFISDKWMVTRWFFGAGAPGDVGAGPCVYVIPPNAPPAANDEIEALEKIFPAHAIWKTVDELNDGLSRPGMGLLHIAAHNTVRYGDPAASSISLDKPFPQAMLGPQLQGVLEHRPLVFINACSSAAPTVQWQGATSWASRFLNAGAGAFIGSNWEVRDGTASVFAQEFYMQARQQQPLGLAFQRARAQSGGPGDPTRFAYSFFGHPDAVLKTQGADTP